MIRTILIPDNQTILINVPKNYVGKEVEVLLYATDELKEERPVKVKPSQFRGMLNLTEEQYNNFQQYIKDTRNEWERDI